MSDTNRPTGRECFDLAVIGGGMAGCAAAFFAARRGIRTAQACGQGGMIFSSGLLDLMGVYPIENMKTWDDPWGAIDAVIKDSPVHPYARAGADVIRKAIDELIAFYNEKEFRHFTRGTSNTPVITSAGTVKSTYALPVTMKAGADALDKKAPCAIVGFRGLKEFSAKQVAEVLGSAWPALRGEQIIFPGTERKNEVFAAHLAQALEDIQTVRALAEALKPAAEGVKYLGIPAVLGIRRTARIHAELEQALGVEVFEIPTMPASVPGLRLKDFFDVQLPALGVTRMIEKRATTVKQGGDGVFTITMEGGAASFSAKNVLIATGRFLGKGLTADRTAIYEPLMDLPVTQPADRKKWHHSDFLNPGGHAANRCGLEIDRSFRPADVRGEHILDNIFIAGSILAHQDWMRMKCGSGLSIATALAAVESCMSIGKK